MMPDKAEKLQEDGSTSEVSVEQLEKGDRVLVKPGGKIPIDGIVVDGSSRVNQAAITGESEPVEKVKDDSVIGGTINGQSSLTVRVEKTGAETYLSQVVEMVEKARNSKSKTQNIADKAAFVLTVVAISVALITLAAWFSAGKHFPYSLERAVTVMITTCPHALGLAIPLVVAVSTSLAAGKGLLVRNRNSFESARNIDVVVFDKTGTLTRGEFGVEKINVINEKFDEDDIASLAGAVEKHSEHPIGEAILAYCREKGLELKEIEGFEAIAGKGAEGTMEGKNIKVVSPVYLEQEGIDYDREKAGIDQQDASTKVFVLVNDATAGLISVTDKIRQESFEAIERLKSAGVTVKMITGDSEKTAAAVAGQLGLDDYYAEVLPDRKSEKIEDLQKKGKKVAMVGDGINDAPALVQADIGIAIGAGTDVAIDSADVVLVESDPLRVADILMLSKKTYTKMIQNLWWAAGYNIVAIPLAAGVLFWAGFILQPAVGAIVMSLSTVIVALNSQSLKFQVN
jgi:Cu2+-exporting ATPase